MGKLIASVAGLVAIAVGALRWLVVLPWAGVQDHKLQWRGLDGGFAALGQMFRQENVGGMLLGSGLVCVGVIIILRLLFSSRVPGRPGAKQRAILFWGLAGGSSVAIHALLVVINFFRP